MSWHSWEAIKINISTFHANSRVQLYAMTLKIKRNHFINTLMLNPICDSLVDSYLHFSYAFYF